VDLLTIAILKHLVHSQGRVGAEVHGQIAECSRKETR